MGALVTQAVADAQARLLEYLKNPTQGQTFGHLMAVLGYDYTDPYSLTKARRIEGVAESRILDRALQKLRKAGKVRFTHNVGWALENHLTAGDLEALKGLAESPCPLVLSPVNAEPLIEAGFVERVAHERTTGTTYRATPAGLKKAAESPVDPAGVRS